MGGRSLLPRLTFKTWEEGRRDCDSDWDCDGSRLTFEMDSAPKDGFDHATGETLLIKEACIGTRASLSQGDCRVIGLKYERMQRMGFIHCLTVRGVMTLSESYQASQ